VRVVLAVFLLCCIASAAPARVLVVGVDGGSWNVIDPLLAAGELPHLAALIERGASAELATVEPVTSPVVWTSIATGRSPEAHGVRDFFSTRATIRVPTIYERLAASGLRVGLYEVLMTWPPASLPGGFVVPAWLRRDESTWPADALETDGPPLFRTVYQAIPTNRAYLEQAWREREEKVRSWNALRERYDPEIGALTFYGVDASSHRYWHASYPEEFRESVLPFSDDEADAVQHAVRGVDRAIGQLAATLAPEDTILVVSDHGFERRDDSADAWITRVEDVIEAHDLDPDRDGFRLTGTFGAVAFRVAPGPFEAREATAQKLRGLLESYRSVDGDPLLRTQIFDVAPRPEGKRRPWTARLRQWGARLLMERVFDTYLDPGAHAVVVGYPIASRLEPLWPDGAIARGDERLPLHRAISRQRFTGTHHPTAIFVAAGGPIAPVSERDELSVLDVAPLVAYLAGRPIPDDLEGELPTAWIAAEHLAAHPPRHVASDELPGLSEDPESMPEVEDPALLEKLRALGYVD
jgi:arylsulfatase A-like enzyme